MAFIDDLKSEVMSIEERFLDDPDQRVLEPGDITDEPTDIQLPSADTEQHVFKSNEPVVPEVAKENEELSEREMIELCMDAALEALMQAKEIIEGIDASVLEDDLVEKFETVAEEAAGLSDKVESIAYEFDVEEIPDEDTIDQTPEEGDDGSQQG